MKICYLIRLAAFVIVEFFILRGSAIAKIVGSNVVKLPHFENRVTMYVYEEMIDGKKLTEIINETHENVKYLPGHKLPENVVSYCILVLKITMYQNILCSLQNSNIILIDCCS